MNILRSKSFAWYLIGIGCVAGGAELSSRLQSMWPLALGAATALMAAAGLVQAIHARQQARARQPR